MPTPPPNNDSPFTLLYTRYSPRPTNPVRERKFPSLDALRKWLDEDDQIDVAVIKIVRE